MKPPITEEEFLNAKLELLKEQEEELLKQKEELKEIQEKQKRKADASAHIQRQIESIEAKNKIVEAYFDELCKEGCSNYITKSGHISELSTYLDESVKHQ